MAYPTVPFQANLISLDDTFNTALASVLYMRRSFSKCFCLLPAKEKNLKVFAYLYEAAK
jgi:hypothetical protein